MKTASDIWINPDLVPNSQIWYPKVQKFYFSRKIEKNIEIGVFSDSEELVKFSVWPQCWLEKPKRQTYNGQKLTLVQILNKVSRLILIWSLIRNIRLHFLSDPYLCPKIQLPILQSAKWTQPQKIDKTIEIGSLLTNIISYSESSFNLGPKSQHSTQNDLNGLALIWRTKFHREEGWMANHE